MAVAQAYFARLLGLPYIAVMPKKLLRRRASNGWAERCRYVDPPLAIYGEAAGTWPIGWAVTTWTTTPRPRPSTGAAEAWQRSCSGSWTSARTGSWSGGHRRHLRRGRPPPAHPWSSWPAGRGRSGELRRTFPAGRAAPPTTPRACRRGSRESAGRAWSRGSSLDLVSPGRPRARRRQRGRRPPGASGHRADGRRRHGERTCGVRWSSSRACAPRAIRGEVIDRDRRHRPAPSANLPRRHLGGEQRARLAASRGKAGTATRPRRAEMIGLRRLPEPLVHHRS